MAKVHSVKKSRKNYSKHGIKKGEPYYWWKTKRVVGDKIVSKKMYSKSPPKRSQLTSSEFLKAVYSIQEQIATADVETMNELRDLVHDWATALDDLRQWQMEQIDNMPNNLKNSSKAEKCRGRIDYVVAWLEGIDSVDIEGDTGNPHKKLNLIRKAFVEPE